METKKNLIVRNGKIFTADGANPYAQSMVMEEGVIRWIGEEAEMKLNYSPDLYDQVDLGGRRVIPGLIDCHMHPIMLADFSKAISSLPPEVNSIEELIIKIRQRAENVEEGSWIEGWGYDEGKLAENRSPNRYDLDRGSADIPVSIVRTCGHIRCVNSKALEMAGIDRNTPDPQGGEIDRDENGEPTGILRENARNLVMDFMPPTTEEMTEDSLVDLGELLASQGIVAVSDLGDLEPREVGHIYENAAKKGFKQKVGIYYIWDHFADNPDFQIESEKFDMDRQIRVAGAKLIGDGSVSGKTAWVEEPYLGTADQVGMPVCSDELLEKAIAFCKEKGCQLSMHAMGSRAIDRIVDRLKDDEDWTGGKAPFLRLEHVTEPSDRAMDIVASRGMAFATQPIFLYAEIESYIANLGNERLKKAYPIKSMMDRGVKVAISTDAPATSWAVPSDPMPCLKAAVTRKAYDGTDCGIGEAVDIETALTLYTKEAAEVGGFRGIGQLKVGYEGHFAVLSEDILNIEPESIDQVMVDETYMFAERIYERKKGGR